MALLLLGYTPSMCGRVCWSLVDATGSIVSGVQCSMEMME